MKDATAGVLTEFDSRDQGQSSVSKYIQAQTPPATGDSFGVNKISGTPDDKTLTPHLTTSTCTTASFSIPTLLGIPLPLPFLKTPITKTIAEPKPTGDKSQYGKIRVSDVNGFVSIRDSTPNNVRSVDIHPSGSYSQVLNNGDMQEKSVYDRVSIVVNDWNISIGNDEITVIVGDQKVQIKRDRQVNIAGDDNLNTDGNAHTVIGKDRGTQVGGSNTLTIEKNNLVDVTGNSTENVKKNFKHTVNGSETNTVMKDKTDVVVGNLTVVVSGNAIIHGKQINISADTMISLSAPAISMN